MFSGESVSSSQVEQFLEEGMLMVNLKHVNILSLIGVAYEKGSFPMVVVPFMANGDLKTFIQRDDMVSFIFITYAHLILSSPCENPWVGFSQANLHYGVIGWQSTESI